MTIMFTTRDGGFKFGQDELKGFSTAKGTIRYALDKPLSPTLVKKFVKARIAQNELKKRR